jgi:DNA-binding cell septation regulator SpoVG
MYEMRVTKLENRTDKVMGLATLVVGGKFAFNSIKVVKSDNTERGFFLSMPSYKCKDGTYKEFFHPVSTEMVNSMCAAVSRAMNTGEKVSFGSVDEVKISTFVDACDFGAEKGKVSMRVGKDLVCDTIKVMENGEGRKFVSMPSVKGGDGEYRQICNPVTAEFRSELYEDILKKQDMSYNAKLNNSRQAETPQVSYKTTVDVPAPEKSK